MTLGKLLVGLWIPIYEMRLRRVNNLAPKDPRQTGHCETISIEGLPPKVDVRRKKWTRWAVMWPNKASVAPAIMLGAAMVARGEIGYEFPSFLI